jgi:septal ring factor EnvC (AmiA/AmiB activator)
LIIDAGDGYRVVLAGMERIDVQRGQFVLAGEPIGTMRSDRVAAVDGVEVGTVRPVLYLEFRRDGTSIDPSPWWADPY